MASAKRDGRFLPSHLEMKPEDVSQRLSENFCLHMGTYLCQGNRRENQLFTGEGRTRAITEELKYHVVLKNRGTLATGLPIIQNSLKFKCLGKTRVKG